MRTAARRALAIDYTAGPGHAPGVGRYVRELVRALVRLPHGPGLRLVELGRAATPMEGAPLGLEGPDVARAAERRRLRLPRRLLARLAACGDPAGRHALAGCALLHRTPLELPGLAEHDGALRIPHTIAVPELPPPDSAADERLARRCLAARGIVVFSIAAAVRVVERYGVPEKRIRVCPVGSEHWARDLEENEGGPREDRDVLVLGAVRADRRPLEVLEAFEELVAAGERARLLWVGRPGDAAPAFEQALDRSPARDRVRWIREPDERRMPGCVAGASALLHLAAEELTPVTPLEGLRMGLPVVASDLPAFREALGAEARWVEAGDRRLVAEALRAALAEARDPDARTRRAALAAPYTWEACARAHRALWDPMLT